MNLVSIIILNRNNSSDVSRLLSELDEQSFKDFNVIIIDDESNDGEYGEIKQITNTNKDVIILPYPEPWIFGNDNKYNLALSLGEQLGSDYLFILQTDMKIQSIALLQSLVSFMQENPKYGIVGPTVTHRGKPSWGPGISRFRMGLENNVSESFMIRATCIKEMGRVFSNFRYFGFEHYIKFWMRENGYFTGSIGGVEVEHSHGGTSSRYPFRKHYYRPRTTIMIMRIFLQEVKIGQKIRYFIWEMYEIKLDLKTSLNRGNIFRVCRVLICAIAGTMAGLVLRLNAGGR